MNQVFEIFENILSIPRESGNEEKIKEYIVDFAKNNNIEYIYESNDIISFIANLKNGLIEKYSADGFPLLSANLGEISLIDNQVVVKYSIRSSDIEKEENLIEECKILSKEFGFEFCLDSKKPFFPFKMTSNIRTLLSNNYERLYSKKPIIKKVHACMEGGILSENIKDLDICTIAPTIKNCHSVNESVSISSTKRVYEWLKNTLYDFNKL